MLKVYKNRGGLSNAYIMERMERELGWFKNENMGDDERRHALAHELGVPFVQIGRDDLSVDALVLIPEPLAREHNLLAYRLDEGSLEIALLDLSDLAHAEFLRSQYRLLPRLTTRESLTRGLIRYQQHLRDVYGRKLEQTDSPTLLDTLLRHALHSRATDMHLQSEQGGLLVRYRVNGSLKNAMTLPPAAGANVIAKLRSLAGVPGGTLPHEGSLRVDLGSGEDLSVRVSSVPTVQGEKLVLHLVREKARRGHTLESLGLHGEALEAVHKRLLARRGLVVVSGPAQSGKSTLLYTLLDVLNVPEISVATVEHDVEYRLPRVAQTDITATGVTSAAALRAALKQDCDVVMISNAQDAEVVRVAEAAAKRGVLVLAATEKPELFASPDLSIRTAVLRRLGGKQMADTYKATRALSEELEASAHLSTVLSALKEEGKLSKDIPWKDVQFTRPTPSTEHPDGYQGYIGIQEVAEAGEVVGLRLAEDAIFKAALGLTSIEEVKKVL